MNRSLFFGSFLALSQGCVTQPLTPDEQQHVRVQMAELELGLPFVQRLLITSDRINFDIEGKPTENGRKLAHQLPDIVNYCLEMQKNKRIFTYIPDPDNTAQAWHNDGVRFRDDDSVIAINKESALFVDAGTFAHECAHNFYGDHSDEMTAYMEEQGGNWPFNENVVNEARHMADVPYLLNDPFLAVQEMIRDDLGPWIIAAQSEEIYTHPDLVIEAAQDEMTEQASETKDEWAAYHAQELIQLHGMYFAVIGHNKESLRQSIVESGVYEEYRRHLTWRSELYTQEILDAYERSQEGDEMTTETDASGDEAKPSYSTPEFK